MSLGLKISRGSLDTKNAKISMVINSPLFSETMPGSYSFPFRLPVSEKNKRLLEHVENSNSRTDRTKTQDVTIENEGNSIFKGKLNVRDTFHDAYDCDVTIPYGNVSPEFWDTPMNELDWGGETLPTKTISPNIFFTVIPEADVKLFGLKSNARETYVYDVVVNGNVIFSHENVVGISPTDNLKTRLEEMTGVFNNQFFPTYQITAVDDSVQIISEDNVLSLELKLTTTSLYGRNFSHIFQKIQAYEEVDTQIFRTLAAENFASKPWRMASMGVENQLVANLFLEDIPGFQVNPTGREIVCPVPTLKMILDGLASQIGFSISGDIYEDANLREICFFSGYVLDKQLEGVGFPFLILDSDFQYAKMMPTWSFRRFVNELRNLNFAVTFDIFRRKITVKKADAIVLNSRAKDLTNKANPKYITRAATVQKKNLRLKWVVDADDPAAKSSEENPIPFFDDYYADNGFDTDDTVECALQPVLEKELTISTGFDLSAFAYSYFPYYVPDQSSIGFFDEKKYKLLVCEKPLYNSIPEKETAPRMFFYKENLEGSSELGAYALHWDKLIVDTGTLRLATGIFTSFWQHTKKVLEDVFEIETDIALGSADLSNIDLTEKIHLWGGNYLIKEIAVDFPIINKSRVKLWRV